MAVLQFLDCLKDLEKCAEEEPEACGRILTGYAREHALTRAVVDRFLAKYPLKIYKAIYETGIDFGTIDADRGFLYSQLPDLRRCKIAGDLLRKRHLRRQSMRRVSISEPLMRTGGKSMEVKLPYY